MAGLDLIRLGNGRLNLWRCLNDEQAAKLISIGIKREAGGGSRLDNYFGTQVISFLAQHCSKLVEVRIV